MVGCERPQGLVLPNPGSERPECLVCPDTGCKQLRGCPPAFGLLLYAAALFTPSAGAAKRVGVRRRRVLAKYAVTGPRSIIDGEALGKLAPATEVDSRRWNTHHDRKSWSMVCSAQRHQGGAGGPRPPRGTAAELSTPSASSRTKQRMCHRPAPVQNNEYAINLRQYKTKSQLI